MAARFILIELKHLFRRNRRIQQFSPIYTLQLTSNFSSNHTINNDKLISFPVLSSNVLQISHNLNYSISRRWKSSKKRESKANEIDSDDDDDIDDNTNDIDPDVKNILQHSKNAKIVNCKVGAMRVDALVKSGMNISRNKTELVLYEGKIRVNGEKPPKKSFKIAINDVIDITHGPSPKNEKFILITRLTILDAYLEDDEYKVKLLQEKSLTIEQYDQT